MLKMYREIILRANGTREESVVSAKEKTLDRLQKIVGGLIQEPPHFAVFEGRRVTVWCNESGILEGLPFNAAASRAWRLCLGSKTCWYSPDLYGDVVLYMIEKG